MWRQIRRLSFGTALDEIDCVVVWEPQTLRTGI
jgi:hypothetical protein